MARTLGLIGSGMIGGALARLAIAAGWNVVLSNSRGPETLAELVGELGELARAGTATEAAEAGELVVATVPLKAYDRLPAAALAGRTVIDTMNYYPERDGRIADLDSGALTSSAMVQRHLASSSVVKAFNNIDFRRLVLLARPSSAADRSALPIAGDDPTAKTQATQLLDALGYDAVDIGPLAESWRSEPGAPVYVQPYSEARPEGLTADQAMRWFLDSPGVPLPADQVTQLVRSTVRGPAGGVIPSVAKT